MSLRCLPPDSALMVQDALVELGYAAHSTAIQELSQDQGIAASGGGGEEDNACVRALRDDLHAMQHTRCGRIVSSPVAPWGFANAFHAMVLQLQRARRLGLTMTWENTFLYAPCESQQFSCVFCNEEPCPFKSVSSCAPRARPGLFTRISRSSYTHLLLACLQV